MHALKSVKNVYVTSFEGLSKGIYLLALMMLLNRMGTLILPFLTLYATEELGTTITQAGFASAAFGLGGLCGAFIGGILTDKIGAYKSMLISLLFSTILFLSLQHLSDFTLFCIVLFFASLMADILRPAVMSCIRLFSKEETQTRALSLMRMSFNLGFAIGPAIAGILLIYFDFGIIFFIDGMTCLLALIFLIGFLNNPKYIVRRPKTKIELNQELRVVSPWLDKSFMLVMVMSFLMLVAFFQILSTVPLFLKEEMEFNERMIGIFFAINGLLIFVLEMPLVYYVERIYSVFSVMIVGCFMIGIGFLFLPIPAIGLIGPAFYMLLISVGEIINFPFISTMGMNRANDQNAGQYMGIVSMMFSLSLIISPIAGTYLLDNFGYTILWLSMVGLCLLSCLGLMVARKIELK